MSYMQSLVRRQQTLTNWLAAAEKSGKITDAVYDISEFLRPAAALVVLRQAIAKTSTLFSHNFSYSNQFRQNRT